MGGKFLTTLDALLRGVTQVLERFHGWVTTSPPPGWQLDAINHEGW